MALSVRPARDDGDIRAGWAVDWSAFQLPLDEAGFERDLPWRRRIRCWLAEDEGTAVGSFGAFDFGLTVPGGDVVPVAGLTAVGVLPSHRRRGVLGTMMRCHLDESAAAGHAASVLYASEAGIYGRFGFGPATRTKRFSLATARASFRGDVGRADARLAVVDRDGWADALPPVFERAARRRPGEVGRDEVAWSTVLAVPRSGKENRLCLAHVGPDGALDGYVLYTAEHHWSSDGPHHVVDVQELVAVDDGVELALWEALCRLDLVERLEGWCAADSILFEALEDRWALTVAGEHDSLWVRLLDVPAALAARRYRVPGRVVLEVADPGRGDGPAAGTFAVEAGADGSATVERCGDAPDVVLGVAELGSSWLGGGSLARLGAVGRVEGTPAALRRADAMFGWYPSPRITHAF